MNTLVVLTKLRLDAYHEGFSHVGASLEELKQRGLPDDVVLLAAKNGLKSAIDVEAERRRGLIVTPGAGQSLEYQEAQAQAAAALKAPASANETKYPMLAATIGIDIDPETGKAASNVVGVARGVQAARDAWLTIGSGIRGARLRGKAAIEAAETLQAAEAAYLAVQWPERPAAA